MFMGEIIKTIMPQRIVGRRSYGCDSGGGMEFIFAADLETIKIAHNGDIGENRLGFFENLRITIAA